MKEQEIREIASKTYSGEEMKGRCHVFHPRKILVPTDFSEDSDLALQMALSIAVTYQARIFLLHVISSTVQQNLADYCLDQSILNRVLNESIVFSNEKLQEVIERNQQSGNIKVIPDIRKGQPYEEILKEAAERTIDLIVIAPHGKTGLQKYFIGSVTEKVMNEAKCPVLLIRSQEK
jgi:universal stress protein A